MADRTEGPIQPKNDATRTTGGIHRDPKPANIEAEPLLDLGYEGVKAKLGELDHRTARTLEHLVQRYEAWPRHEAAARYRAIIDGMNAP